MIHNDLHLEMGKFKTFNISQSEIIDLGMRYALGKQEFRRLAAEVIERKEEDNKSKINNSGKIVIIITVLYVLYYAGNIIYDLLLKKKLL